MTLLPPVGWADVATKHALGALEDAFDLRFTALGKRIDHLEERMELRFQLVDQKLETLRHEAREEFERGLKNQTRTLFLGMLASLATMTSLCLGAITLVA